MSDTTPSRQSRPARTTTDATMPGASPDDVRERLLALAAHDLRNPLNTLSGFLEIVHEEMAGPLTAKQREFLGYARSSAQQVAFLFETVLALSRGAHPLVNQPLALGEVVGEAIHALAPMAEAARVTPHLEPLRGRSASLVVLGEREALGLALRQLLANAILVAPAECRVEVVIGREAEHASAERAYVCIADAGPSVSEGDCAALLEDAVQGERLTRERDAVRTLDGVRGNGAYRLRLAVARLEIARLGGTLALTPGEETGLVARVHLPLAMR